MATKFRKKHTYVSKEVKKEKRMKLIMSVILAGLMFFSVFSIGLSYLNTEKITYNGLKFKQEETDNGYFYTTKLDGKEVFFYTRPNVSMNLPVEGDLSFLNKASTIIFTVNPRNKIASVVDLLRYEYSDLTDKNLVPAVDDVYEEFPQLQKITCENSTKDYPVVYFKETNESSTFKVENNCVLIETNLNEIVYVRDRLLLNILGIAIE